MSATAAPSAPAIFASDTPLARREATRYAAASQRLRHVKMLLGVVLGVLFWFSVPYSMPQMPTSGDVATIAANDAAQFQGSISRQVAVPLIAAAALYMLWRLPRRGQIGGRLWTLVLLYAGFCAASVLWSEDPSLTAKRLVVFACDALFAYALARTATFAEMALWGFLSTGIVGLLSLFSDIFLAHTFAPFDPEYRLLGAMTANYQAMNLVVFCLCAAVLVLRQPRWGGWLTASLACGVLLLVLTRARIGSFVCFALLLFVANRLLRDRLRPQVRAVVLVLVFAAGVPAAVYLAGTDLQGAAQRAFQFGRNDSQNAASLSNRLPLWTELVDSVATRPWLGFGYGAFWTPARAERISLDQGWPVPHAHNTYLDQVISLGMIGGPMYAAIMLTACVVAWQRYRRQRSASNMLPVLLLTWLVLLSLSESTPLEPHLPTMLVYAAVVRMCVAEGTAERGDETADAGLIEGLPGPDPVDTRTTAALPQRPFAKARAA